MRTLALLRLAVLPVAFCWSAPARAQVTEAERVVARELFKEGDELQRVGRFTEALDKFQRAEGAYSAPTNVLRIAECQAALGKLVESTESYRAIVRTPLPAGAPQAFRAAIEQAKGELGQVEPRVPKLIVRVGPRGEDDPSANAKRTLLIDGQRVSSALIGEPIPLDPGIHRVRVSSGVDRVPAGAGNAPSGVDHVPAGAGNAAFEQDVLLKERETTTVIATLKPAVDLAHPPPPLPDLPAAPIARSTPDPPSAPPPYALPPPPPLIADRDVGAGPRLSSTGLLVGGHLGWEMAVGAFPLDAATKADANIVAAGGLAYAVEGGLRFARHWYVGLTFEHAELAHGDLTATGVTDASSSTTVAEGLVGFIGNPDRVSFYGELGAGIRWFNFTETFGRSPRSASYNNGELGLGIGMWLPVGHTLRLLPKITLGIGSFDPGGSGARSAASQGHAFWMLGASGFYNLDL
jgi:hypothetical protein